MDLGPHASTIIACYVIVGSVLAGLIIWLIMDGLRMQGKIAELEQRGIRRRSAAASPVSPVDAPHPQPEPNSRE